ncbi:MAG: hypothetical protein ABIA59_08825 [Candidatus Latescibacterota bacterium]
MRRASLTPNTAVQAGTTSPTAPPPVFFRKWLSRFMYAAVLALTAIYAFAEHQKSVSATALMEEASLRFSIYLITEGLHAYRDSTGTLPATLAEAHLDEEGIEYRSNGSTYRLVVTEGSRSMVYVEGDALDRYGAAFTILEGGAVR